MTVRTGICVLVVAASVAWAQDTPMSTINDTRRLVNGIGKATEQRRENAAKQLGLSSSGAQASSSAATATGNSISTKTARHAGVNSRESFKPRKSAGKPKISTSKKIGANANAATAPSEGSEGAEADKTSDASAGNSAAHNVRGHRDPFMSVIRSEPIEGVGCGLGKKCLQVEKMELKGIVRSENGMIAVVENQQRKTYFLHENDPIFKGHVVKINPDSVVFQQTVVDRVGRQSTKDVVKRLSGPAV
jgi:hypothetical protein